MRTRFIPVGVAAVFCTSSAIVPCFAEPGQAKDAVREHHEWIRQREASLRSPEGYLALSGLFWITDGEHRVGSAAGNDIVFPNNRGAGRIGRLIVQDGRGELISNPDADVTHDGNPVNRIRLVPDGEGEPTRLRSGPVTFWLIERYGMLAIRLRDPQSPVLRNYAATPRFPFSPNRRVEAQYEPAEGSPTVRVPSVLGKSSHEAVTGRFRFALGGTSHTLHATGESNGEAFIILGDETNGHQTYHGGRFLRVAVPADGGRTIIDFNRAHNPPCAYSRFTTCPLVPEENDLPLRIEAGEMMSKKGD